MLAIIPARGGSKGVPKKNIKLLGGKPLILWTIETALKSKYIDNLILSTDSSEIAEICSESGVNIPFMRPNELASDDSIATDTYIYTIDKLNDTSTNKYQDFVVLHPTSPLRLTDDIDNAIELFFNKKADSVISCAKALKPPLWAVSINESGILHNYFNFDESNMNRQDLEKAYYPNGAVQVYRYSIIKEQRKYYTDKTYAYLMPQERSIDIDTEHDFKLAEYILKNNNT